jgi:ferredoxin
MVKVYYLGAEDKRGNFVLKISDTDFDLHKKAADVCPVKIIDVRE